jgi:hypothetical protein
MDNSDYIADRIEEIIGRMFAHFKSFDPGATEYSIFYNPKRNPSWFILIFFADRIRLREGLKDGICYQMYNFLTQELDSAAETSNIERSISFEFGARPKEQNDIDHLFELLVKKQEVLKTEVNKTHIGACGNCGHDFDKHQLLCNLNEDNATPTQGWIICPEEDCNCFQTWSANYKAATH